MRLLEKGGLMKKITTGLIIVVAAIIVLSIQFMTESGPFKSAGFSNANEQTYKVLRVVDGDTIIVDKDGKQEKVRMIGVDTPETVKPNTPVQPYGKEASDFTKRHLTNQKVRLEYDKQEKDRYGRTLAYVWLGKEMFNEKLAKEGLARAKFYRPNYKYQERIEQAQKEAQKLQKNIWSR